MNSRGVWLRYWYLWAMPALVVIVNGVWLFWMQGQFLGGGTLLEHRAEQLEKAVAALQTDKKHMQRSLNDLRTLQVALTGLRDTQLATMRQRLIPFLVDVVKRAQEAGLAVERVGYSLKKDDKSGLVFFTASYNVKGTYEQIRRCVFLIETSPQFIILDTVSLHGQEGPTSLEVSVQLSMGTYFSDIDPDVLSKIDLKEIPSGEQN